MSSACSKSLPKVNRTPFRYHNFTFCFSFCLWVLHKKFFYYFLFSDTSSSHIKPLSNCTKIVPFLNPPRLILWMNRGSTSSGITQKCDRLPFNIKRYFSFLLHFVNTFLHYRYSTSKLFIISFIFISNHHLYMYYYSILCVLSSILTFNLPFSLGNRFKMTVVTSCLTLPVVTVS